MGEQGIIQTLSVLPTGVSQAHSLLTEDEGILLGEDDCTCGRLGKYFKIVGRIKNAEIRGCSDTYGMNFKDLTLLNISNEWDIEGFKALKPMTPLPK